MHGQAHALHLFQHGDERLAAVHRDIDVDFIQRGLPQPVHIIIVVGRHLDPGQRAAHVGCRGFQDRHAADVLGPVALQLGNKLFGAVLRGDKPDQAFQPRRALHFQ